jgi:small subunit ribosomal protein S20
VANTRSAKKRIRQNERRRIRNRGVRSKVRTAVKIARSTDGAEMRTSIADAIRILDKAVSKGVIHRNQAANRKSAMAKRANQL